MTLSSRVIHFIFIVNIVLSELRSSRRVLHIHCSWMEKWWYSKRCFPSLHITHFTSHVRLYRATEIIFVPVQQVLVIIFVIKNPFKKSLLISTPLCRAPLITRILYFATVNFNWIILFETPQLSIKKQKATVFFFPPRPFSNKITTRPLSVYDV